MPLVMAAPGDHGALATWRIDDLGNRATVTTTLFRLPGVLAATSKAYWSAGAMSMRMLNR